MKLRHALLNIALLWSVFFTSCGPSEEEQKATATAIVANVFATQTAEAPAVTFTPTNTATPTETSTPLPTDTPTAAAEPNDAPSATPELTTVPDPAAALITALPVLEDLPSGFRELPPDLMNFAMGSGASELFGPTAAFMDMASNEFVITVLTPIEAEFQRALFEQQLEDPETLVKMMGVGLAAGGGSSPEFDYELLPEIDDIGDKALGIRASLGVEGQSFVYDLVVMIRSDVGAVIGVLYGSGNEPPIDVLDLAELVDGRLMDLASGASGG